MANIFKYLGDGVKEIKPNKFSSCTKPWQDREGEGGRDGGWGEGVVCGGGWRLTVLIYFSE